MRVAIVGEGRVGRALFRAADASASVHAQIVGRKFDRDALHNVDLLIIATTDDAITEVDQSVADLLSANTSVVHCAGARGPEALFRSASNGHPVGVLHPLLSFRPDGNTPLNHAYFVFAGDTDAAKCAKAFTDAIDAHFTQLDSLGPLYHASAALVANGATALAFAAQSLLQSIGFDPHNASKALAALLRSVSDNIAETGLPSALTGPVARGDVETIRAHRQSLTQTSKSGLETYDAMLPAIVACARAAGLSREKADAILHEVEDDPFYSAASISTGTEDT